MRKICIIVNSRANYGRIKTVLQSLKNDSNIKLQIVVGASAVLERFGNVSKIISNDGFKIDSKLYSVVEGENPTTMAKSTGLAIIELSTMLAIAVSKRYPESLNDSIKWQNEKQNASWFCANTVEIEHDAEHLF